MTSTDEASKVERLLAFMRDLGAASNREQFLKCLATAASNLTNSASASVLKFDETSSALRFLSASSSHWEPLKNVVVPLDESLAGWAFGNNQHLIVENVANDPRHYKAADQAINFTTTSLVAVPMTYQGNTIGVLEAVNKQRNAHYTEDDVTILEILALNGAMALWHYNLEEHFKSPREEFAELDRLKKNFIGITSHELRTPLGLILGHATFLNEMVADEYHEPVETIIRNATRLKEIIENLTDVDNYETGVARVRRNTISISDLVKDVVASFQEMSASKKIALQAKVPDKDLQIVADESKITVALSNLIRNAITFTDEGGQILVAVETVTGYIQVSVKDNGIGIPASDLAHIFERFFQVESHLVRRHSGMGLGLSVAKTMIELHGGRIWVESVEGQGSIFTFLLPLSHQLYKSNS